jgi:hypothetical protein
MVAVAMPVHLDFSGLGETKWYEYAVRFVFGGLITAIAGIVAKTFGPVVGGLFLAFPAIFPTSATLVEKHERRKARRDGKKNPELAGRIAVAVDAAGAALGTIALFAFALIVWQFEPLRSAWLVLPVATLVWISVSLLLWWLGERLHAPHERSQVYGNK